MIFWLTARLRFSSPARTAKLLLSFARAERSSHYDMMAAANASPDPSRRALYLHHATDEARHALMFTARAKELAPALAADPRETHADFEQLYARLGEEKFVAFVHHGERRGCARLTRYRDELARRGDEKSRGILDAILVDEARHVEYTAALVTQFGRSWLRSARVWEALHNWRRAGGVLSGLVFTLTMRVLYLLLWPLALIEKRK